MASTQQEDIVSLADLVSRISQVEGFKEVLAQLESRQPAGIEGTWGSSSALAVAALAAHAPGTLLVVLPRMSEIDSFAGDLQTFIGQPPLIFPAWESLPQEYDVRDAVFGARLRVLQSLGEEHPPSVVLTSFPALLQPVPQREEIEASSRTLQVGEEVALEELLSWLLNQGLERVTAVELPGEFSLHGGILDVFASDAEYPLRLEFFGDEIASIRRFDIETQRKLEELSSARLTVVSPRSALTPHPSPSGRGAGGEGLHPSPAGSESGHLLDALPEQSWIALKDLPDSGEAGANYLARLDDPRSLFSVEATMARIGQSAMVTLSEISTTGEEPTCRLPIESVERFSGKRSEVLEELATVMEPDEQAIISCHNEGEQQRLLELLQESAESIASRVQLVVGQIAGGFRLLSERLLVLSDYELFGRSDVRRPKPRRVASRAIDSFLDLNPGDLVVHLSHGIARYRGMELLDKKEQAEEHLILEFRDGIRVYVPASLIHLVQKYVGAAGAAPQLSKLGSKSWAKKKAQVARAVDDLAGDMLQLQAAREAKPGIAFPADSHWQIEFDAAFPFEETDDQLRTIAELKDDMQRARPMDRLICGDVGYGKTEIAMRAAFKAIDSGRQVAMLVPTTVLAEQHFRTFVDRMAEYPIEIEVLSRFKTKAEQRDILKRMQAGSVDLVIGTHRLIQKDVQFKDLGLLIIDEEQRFGVEAKELLKQLRLEVDVLTLSATPIPRTLHMALMGIRDISNLQTPPQDRLAVETRLVRFDPELIRSAIVRELNRGGQVYFVHNRVYNIHQLADRIRHIVPEAVVDVAHGQMPGGDLETAMLAFVRGQTDVLVCTTIIESGLDIPNANTMFIHQAGNYGLADMHQLRGRVGRYHHRAYCYLVLEEGKPLTANAAKRLKAIEEFSELGAGFKISMRDLEIRGAGNILGTEQSGHIASVGYELYCQLLENAVRRARNEPTREIQHVTIDLPVSAYLSEEYVPPGRPKIELYRKLSQIRSEQELQEFEDELRDRFGSPMPEETVRLLRLKELELLARQWQITSIHLEDRFVVFDYQNAEKIGDLRKQRGSQLRVVDSRQAYWLASSTEESPDVLLDELKSVLQAG